jgi:hypothetical protein
MPVRISSPDGDDEAFTEAARHLVAGPLRDTLSYRMAISELGTL